jgi:hypothetical protein
MRARGSGIDRHRPLVVLPGGSEIAALEGEHSEVLQRNAAVGIDREHALEHPARLGGAAGARVRDAETVQRVGVRGRTRRERFERRIPSAT